MNKEMNKEMKIAIMEKESPELLKTLDIGECKVIIKKPTLVSKGRIILLSDVLYKLEKKAEQFLDKGLEVLKSVFIKGTKYCVIFSYETNPNSPHLQLKRSIEESRKVQNRLIKKFEKEGKLKNE